MTIWLEENWLQSSVVGGEAASLSQCLAPIIGDISDLKSDITSFLSPQTSTASSIFSHVCSHPGKMVRPALFLLAARLVEYKGAYLKSIAAVCEFIHTASLLHDDVVDKSDIRRGASTANRLWGDEESVLTGDLIYARASELMAETGKVSLIQMFARAIREMSEGELLQLENQFNTDISQDIYEKILSGKTAFLMGACCSSAAILGESDHEQKDALFDFGYNVGMAFQYMDDGLDYFSSTSQAGKSVFADLAEGRITLPIILLRSHLNENDWEHLVVIVRNLKQFKQPDPKDHGWIKQMIDKYGISEQLAKKAEKKTVEAKQVVEKAFSPSKERDQLIFLADVLLSRVK